MRYDINPFQELYWSDDLKDEFVDLFSPIPLQSAINPLFQDTNVVLTGTQGCGKTMILRLLLPETRIAYSAKNEVFPIKDAKQRRFISAGVNLTRSAICHIAGVTLGKGDDHDREHLPFYFADFLNFWVVRDLLKTVHLAADNPLIFENICNLSSSDSLASCMARQDCWSGAMDGCTTLKEIEDRIDRRIEIYHRWVSQNELTPEAQKELAERKTGIGEPIARTAECLRSTGVLDDEARVFIRVDQLEELHLSPLPRQRQLRLGFRHLLNRAFAARDRRVHYRIGTRRFGWNQPEQLIVHGSGAKLEAKRDYLHIDLEKAFLSRNENRSGWLFGDFAEDTFKRRLAYAFKAPPLLKEESLAKRVLGRSPSRTELAAEHLAKSRDHDAAQAERVLGLNEADEKDLWSPEWRAWLANLYRSDPLRAMLAAAWGRQTGGRQGKREHRAEPPPAGDDSWIKPWWRKERLDQAILQLAARRAQRMLWWGYEDAINLSSPNISVFLHLCQMVWDLFLKIEGLKAEKDRIDPIESDLPIPREIQSAGIQSASAAWYEKLSEQPGGDVRKRFIEKLGKTLRQQLRNDRKMSYPGANGFSLERDSLETEAPELWQFLRDAVGYGDLHGVDHTTKNKAGEARMKFYLNPILSPAFQIPAAHTKEPLYWKIAKVMELAREARLGFALQQAVIPPPPPTKPDAGDPSQLRLFSE